MVDIMIEHETRDTDDRADSDQDQFMSGRVAALFILILIILVLLVVVAILLVVRRRKRKDGHRMTGPFSRWVDPEPAPTLTDLDSIYSDVPMPSTRDRAAKPPKKVAFGLERAEKLQRVAPPYVPPLSYYEIFSPEGKCQMPEHNEQDSFDEPDFLEQGGDARWM